MSVEGLQPVNEVGNDVGLGIEPETLTDYNHETNLTNHNHIDVEEQLQFDPSETHLLSDNEIDFRQRIKDAQWNLSCALHDLKDAESKFAASSGEFIVACKRLIPPTVQHFSSVQDFRQHVQDSVKTSQHINIEPIQRYFDLLERIAREKVRIERTVKQPLGRILEQSESTNQQSVKVAMDNALRDLTAYLEEDFDVSNLRHLSWRGKVIIREDPLFYGLLSLISFCVECIDRICHDFDEYVSGLFGKVLLPDKNC